MILFHISKRFIALILLPFLVIACANNDKKGDIGVACPEILIPQHTQSLTKFNDRGFDITDIRYQAGIGYLSGECEITPDEIIMRFPIIVEVRKGPAFNQNESADIGIILAVTSFDRKILSRSEFPYRLRFSGNNPVASLNDPISIMIPKRPDQQGEDFLVYMSLNLSRSELDYNRAQESP